MEKYLVKTVNNIEADASGNVNINSQTPWTSNINAAGYTLFGNSISGGTLTLSSTSHATKGDIRFGTSAYDEVNNRLGIGTATPGYKLEVDAGNTVGIIQQLTTTSSDSFMRISSWSRYVKIGTDANFGAQIITNAVGFAMPDAGGVYPLFNGSLTNLSANLGSASYAFGDIYANHANFLGTGNNYFAGKVGIGQATPTALLHLKAGTATASTSPLKFTSGTNLTTPENGAMEFDGTNLYFTVGGVRKTVTLV